MMIEFFLLSLATYYLTDLLLIQPRQNGMGLWEDRQTRIYLDYGNGESQYEWNANFFDRLRGVFGIYSRDGRSWHVRVRRAAVFLCPICLSFWVSLYVNTIYWLFYRNLAHWALYTFACAGAVSVIFQYLERVAHESH